MARAETDTQSGPSESTNTAQGTAQGTTAQGEGTLAKRVAERQVPKGHVIAWWLGASGFIFKSPGGVQIYIDPYLSNIVKDIFGLQRAFPTPVEAEDARPDVVIATHWHEDHLDPGAIPIIARHSPTTQFVMPPSALSRAVGWGVSRSRMVGLRGGESLRVGDVTIRHAPARHEAGIPGWEAPDAMGVILDIDGLRIYQTGDTDYHGRLRLLKEERPDVAIICINGVTGNMNAHEAALLAWQLGVSTAIPMHHLLWASLTGNPEETLDPTLMVQTYSKLGGTGQVVIPQIGGEIDLFAGART